jgi:hypothetical protein
MNPPPQKFLPGTLVKGIPFANDYIQHPMIGIIICESDRSNWWGDIYTRWYRLLAENGKIVEEVENYIEPIT